MTDMHEGLAGEKEGVIKYQLHFSELALSENALAKRFPIMKKIGALVSELNASRSLLKNKGLIGQDPLRYGGDGFGNISLRLDGLAFLVSGSQTGHLDILSDSDLAVVEAFSVALNQLSAFGLVQPSSESMTHGVCYQFCSDISAVIHIHSPDIWHFVDALELPYTDADIPYGTPEMAQAVTDLLTSHYCAHQPTIFAMKGHEDGVVVVGENLAMCTSALLSCLNQSLLLKRPA